MNLKTPPATRDIRPSFRMPNGNVWQCKNSIAAYWFSAHCHYFPLDWQQKIGYVKYFICYRNWHLFACSLCQCCQRDLWLYEIALYTDCGFHVMFQCFSWHNLRYIKNRQNLEVFNANIIVFLQGIMYVHNRWQLCACTHMCTQLHARTSKNIFSCF